MGYHLMISLLALGKPDAEKYLNDANKNNVAFYF